MAIDAKELEIELHRVMDEVMLSLLGEAEPSRPSLVDREERSTLACSVAIHGGFEGLVVVKATFGIASLIAEHMFGDDLTGPPTGRDAQDALREVSNIIAGNLKPLFGEHNNLGLPEDLPSDSGSSDSRNPTARQLAKATSVHPSGVLEALVYSPL